MLTRLRFFLRETINMRRGFFARGICGVLSVLSFLLPFSASAFTVSPSVVDFTVPSDGSSVSQVVSLLNTTDIEQTYEAKVQEVFFAEDGSIASFAEVDRRIGASVDVSRLTLLPGEEGALTIAFAHPEEIRSSHVFGLVITEKNGEVDQLSQAFVVLFFPEGALSETLPMFRIDLFTILREGKDFVGVAQFTNTGEALVRPASLIVVTDRFHNEIGRYAFAQYEGRLPLGTSRTISSMLPFSSFGWWHPGGDVTFTLLSVADGGNEVQQASVVYATRPGVGVLFVGALIILFGSIFVLFLWKRRGILRR